MKRKAIFPMGQIVATPSALKAIEAAGQTPTNFLKRHLELDRGELSDADHGSNKTALTFGYRIFSVYKTAANATLWVITEADRSSTCILLPEEY